MLKRLALSYYLVFVFNFFKQKRNETNNIKTRIYLGLQLSQSPGRVQAGIWDTTWRFIVGRNGLSTAWRFMGSYKCGYK